MIRSIIWIFPVFVVLTGALGAAESQVAQAPRFEFELADGGHIEGRLLNQEQKPLRHYDIRTDSGVRVMLDRDQVVRAAPLDPNDVFYRRERLKARDIVEDQWVLAQWCEEQGLLAEAQRHWRRIIELEPEHEAARRALGYVRKDGRWTTQEEQMLEQGYVRYDGEWMLPQEVRILQRKEQQQQALIQWRNRIDVLRDAMRGDRATEARQTLLSIRDPLAATVLIEQLPDERDDHVRMLYLKVLARIGTPGAITAIGTWAMREEIEDVRILCFELLEGNRNAAVYFAGLLDSSDNDTINEAATALGYLGQKGAVRPLIDALQTTHSKSVTIGSPGQTSGSFTAGPGGTGGPGFTMGSTTVKKTKTFRNEAVYEALLKLTREEGVDFGYDEDAWLDWWNSKRKLVHFDARRG